MPKGQSVGYIRVSTVDQNTERQLDGMELDRVFTDKASGKDVKRPQLQAALQYLRDGDTLYVHSLDRLARNDGSRCAVQRRSRRKARTTAALSNSAPYSMQHRGIDLRVTKSSRRR